MTRIKRTIFKVALIIAAFTMGGLQVQAAGNYDITAAKAARFFDAREWASAEALYGLMLDERPDVDSTYIHAIVASSMLGRSTSASELLANAMKAGVSFTRLMSGVKTLSFAIGEPAVYEDFLLRSQRDCPWLSRAIDSELLAYYRFRCNGELTVFYAQKMLAGLPDSTAYLSALAEGYTTLGDFPAAVDTWQRIIELDPTDYLTLLKLGNYFDIAGDSEAASRWLARADALHPTPYVAGRLAALDLQQKKH